MGGIIMLERKKSLYKGLILLSTVGVLAACGNEGDIPRVENGTDPNTDNGADNGSEPAGDGEDISQYRWSDTISKVPLHYIPADCTRFHRFDVFDLIEFV